MYQHPTCSTAHSRLAGCALATSLLLGCGGGGSDNVEAAPAAAPVAVTAATAYAKTIETTLYVGKSYGLGHDMAEAAVDVCNAIRRSSYQLPPVVPGEVLLASFDVSTVEKYFSADKALTTSTGALPDVPDVLRWYKDAAGGSLPVTPPDCVLSSVETRQATLWRDGIVYRFLSGEKKVIGHHATPIPAPEHAAQQFADAPEVHVLGQTCRDIVNPTGLVPGSNSCVWDLFPYVSNLNWPFILRGRLQADVVGMTRTIEALEARAGQPIDSSVFEIPADLKVVVD